MSLPPINILFVYQGALVGWGAGLVLTFWIGIGSIVTQTSSTSLLPSGCIPILSVNATVATTTTATLQAAFSNVTRRYRPQLHTSAAVSPEITPFCLCSIVDLLH